MCVCVCVGGGGSSNGGKCTYMWCTHCHTERYSETPEVFTPIHHYGIGLCSQCEFIIGGFPLVQILIEPLLAIIKRLGVDNVHETSE